MDNASLGLIDEVPPDVIGALVICALFAMAPKFAKRLLQFLLPDNIPGARMPDLCQGDVFAARLAKRGYPPRAQLDRARSDIVKHLRHEKNSVKGGLYVPFEKWMMTRMQEACAKKAQAAVEEYASLFLVDKPGTGRKRIITDCRCGNAR